MAGQHDGSGSAVATMPSMYNRTVSFVHFIKQRPSLGFGRQPF
jgi:hypothetical protein